jgi:hypothetical protein
VTSILPQIKELDGSPCVLSFVASLTPSYSDSPKSRKTLSSVQDSKSTNILDAIPAIDENNINDSSFSVTPIPTITPDREVQSISSVNRGEDLPALQLQRMVSNLSAARKEDAAAMEAKDAALKAATEKAEYLENEVSRLKSSLAAQGDMTSYISELEVKCRTLEREVEGQRQGENAPRDFFPTVNSSTNNINEYSLTHNQRDSERLIGELQLEVSRLNSSLSAERVTVSKLQQLNADISSSNNTLYTAEIAKLKAAGEELFKRATVAEGLVGSWREESETKCRLLQQQVTALSNIVSNMERSLSVSIEPGKEEAVSNQYLKVLTAWRDKVYGLLLQRETEKLSHMKVKGELERQVSMLESSITELQANGELHGHKTDAIKAELELSKETATSLQKSISVLEEKQRNSERLIQASKVALGKAYRYCMSVHMDFQSGGQAEREARLLGALSRLASHEKRIAFAASRLKVATVLISRREAQLSAAEASLSADRREWIVSQDVLCTHSLDKKSFPIFDNSDSLYLKGKIGKILNGSPPIELISQCKSISTEGIDSWEAERVRSEFLLVLKERDMLLQSISQDNVTVQRRGEEVYAIIAAERAVLLREIEDLKAKLSESASKVDEYSNRDSSFYDELKRVKKEGALSIERLQKEVNRLILVSDRNSSEWEKERTELMSEYDDRLSSMTMEVNGLKRENAKQTINLRALDRELSKSRAEIESLHKARLEAEREGVERTNHALQKLRRERNALLATLREHENFKKYCELSKSPSFNRAASNNSNVISSTALPSTVSSDVNNVSFDDNNSKGTSTIQKERVGDKEESRLLVELDELSALLDEIDDE